MNFYNHLLSFLIKENIMTSKFTSGIALGRDYNTFFRVLENLNKRDYYELVLSQILNHVKHLNISLAAAQLKLHLEHPEDVIMEETSTFSSVLVEKTLGEIKKKAELMEVQLIELQTVSFPFFPLT